MDVGSRRMEKILGKKDLIFGGFVDCLDKCGENDPLIEKMHAWIGKICSEETSLIPADEK